MQRSPGCHPEDHDRSKRSRRRHRIGRFLRARRAHVTPAQVGLPAAQGRRRTTGLRREELATLAGISNDYDIVGELVFKSPEFAGLWRRYDAWPYPRTQKLPPSRSR